MRQMDLLDPLIHHAEPGGSVTTALRVAHQSEDLPAEPLEHPT